MVLNLATVSAVCLSLALVGWKSEVQDPQPKLDSDTPSAHSNSPLSSSKYWFEFPYCLWGSEDCGCQPDINDETLTKVQKKEPPKGFLHWSPYNKENDYQSLPKAHSLDDKRTPFFGQKNKMAVGSNNIYDVIFGLTSFLQLYWLYKVVIRKGLKAKILKDRLCQTDFATWATESKLTTKCQFDAEDVGKAVESLRFRYENEACNLKRKELELEELAKTVEYLQMRCQRQDSDLQRRGALIEEMALTIEQIQQPTKQKVTDILGKVNKDHSSLVTDKYYSFQVCVDDGVSSDSVDDGYQGDSDDMGVALSESELAWDF